MEKRVMQTVEERYQDLKAIFSDPDLVVSLRETIKYHYHWYMYERAVINHRYATNAINKHGGILNAERSVFALRKEMNNL